MRLEHVVVTSVARDDLPDGGSRIFAETIRAMRRASPGMGIEVLIPDFDGADDRLRTVMDARPDILNHNLETVRRLQKPVRKRARWDRSLYVLRRAKEMAVEIGYAVHTKSSLMVGLGETRDELTEAFEALRDERRRHPDRRPVPPAVREAPAARALLPPRRVRRHEGRGARARLQARRVGAARPLELPRPRPGPRRRAQGAPPAPGDARRRRPDRPGARARPATATRGRPLGYPRLDGRQLSRKIPLAELHCHLGGAVTPAIMWSIAHAQGIKLPTRDYWEFRDTITVSEKRNRSFDGYLQLFHWTELIQSSPIAVERAVYEVVGGAYRKNNVTTMELRFNPMKRNRGGEQDLDHIIAAAARGMDRASLEYPVKPGLIFCLDRAFPFELNEIIVEKAIAWRDRGVVGDRHRRARELRPSASPTTAGCSGGPASSGSG